MKSGFGYSSHVLGVVSLGCLIPSAVYGLFVTGLDSFFLWNPLEQLSIFNVEHCTGEDCVGAASMSSLWFGRGFKSWRRSAFPQKTQGANLFVIIMVLYLIYIIWTHSPWRSGPREACTYTLDPRFVYEIPVPESPVLPPDPKEFFPTFYDGFSSYFFAGGWRALLGILTCLIVAGFIIWLVCKFLADLDVRLVNVQFYMLCVYLALVLAVFIWANLTYRPFHEYNFVAFDRLWVLGRVWLGLVAALAFWLPPAYVYDCLKEFLEKHSPFSLSKTAKRFFDLLALAFVWVMNTWGWDQVVKYQPLVVLEDNFFKYFKAWSEYFTAFPEDLSFWLIVLFMLSIWIHEKVQKR